jgi:hypothetical protein
VTSSAAHQSRDRIAAAGSVGCAAHLRRDSLRELQNGG